MTSVPVPAARSRAESRPRRKKGLTVPRVGLHTFLILTSLVWITPVLWAVFTSFRPYADTAKC